MEPSQTFFVQILKMMSTPDFDAEAFAKSESFAGMVENKYVFDRYRQEDCPEVLAYWRDLGLVKELHDVEPECTKWASYLPLSFAENPENGRTYPLLFVMHGSGNPIYLAESMGYVHIAAREEVITIIPEDETPESIEALLAYARAHYPVDWSRVYMIGYSLGGFMTARHALRWPERFAAVGIGGMLFANGWAASHVQAGKLWPGETITPEMVQRAAGYHIPACICMGECEVLGLIPVTQDEPANQWTQHLAEEEKKRAEDGAPQEERIDLSGKNKIASINNFRVANGCPPVPETEVRGHTPANIVEEKIGFPFERTEVIIRENRAHFVGDSVSKDGETRLRLIGIAQSPHSPSKALTELTWEFVSRFSRDPETGKSLLRAE